MKIFRNNTELADIWLSDDSFIVEEIKGEHLVNIQFSVLNPFDFTIDDYIFLEGSLYSIRYKERIIKEEELLGYKYNILFYHELYKLQDVPFFLFGKRERKKNFDTFTGTALQVLQLVIKCMNAELGVDWKIGTCIETSQKTYTLRDMQCSDVINKICTENETEYWMENKTLSIGRREYASNGLVLGQGDGMGFKELEISATDDTPPYTVVYPYGGDKNIPPDYGSDWLLLPDGLTELTKNVEKYGRRGKHVQFEHIFPKGEFHVTKKIDNFTFEASDIDFNITDNILGENEVLVSFQTGSLGGYDLAIKTKKDGKWIGWDNSKKQITLSVKENENALKVPGDINFSVGDKFILTGLKMPQKYTTNNENILKEESLKWLDRNCENKVQLRAKCDNILFRRNKYFIKCGQMIGVYSDELNINREIRVTAVKKYLENPDKAGNLVEPYRYELTLSDFLQGNGFKELADNVKELPKEIEIANRGIQEWTKRSFQDVMETLGMMFDPESDYYTEIIHPLAVMAAMAVFGTNSQQMELINVKFIPNADNDPNFFRSTAGSLVHFTINGDNTSRTWPIGDSVYYLNNSNPHYVYAKCPRTGTVGQIIVSTQQVKLQDDPNYYHFWIGVLNSVNDGVRSWSPKYGYSEIAGQTITTGVIKDRLARLVIDLVNATITATNGAKIRGTIEFMSSHGYVDLNTVVQLLTNDITSILQEIGEVSLDVSDLSDYVDGAFADGIISEAEAAAIEKYLNTLNETMSQVEATYNKLYMNSYLEGTPKTTLLNAKINLFFFRDELRKAIDNAIADGRTTAIEKSNVDSKFNSFNSYLAAFQNAVEDANKAIQQKIDDLSSEKVANLVYGGVNLLTNSDKLKKAGYANPDVLTSLETDGTLKVVIGSNGGYMSLFLTDPKYNFDTLKSGDPFIISYWAKSSNSTKKPAPRINTQTGWMYDVQGEMKSDWSQMWVTGVYKSGTPILDIAFYNLPGTYYFHKFKIERGNKPTDWSPSPSDMAYAASLVEFDYLKTALTNRTTIDGGLLLTALLKLGVTVNNSFVEKAGINGTAKADNDVVAWFGGTLQQAIQSLAAIVFRMDGSGQLAGGNIKWDKPGNVDLTGKITSNASGNRVIIDPSDVRKIKLTDGLGYILGTMGFTDSGTIRSGRLELSGFNKNNASEMSVLLLPEQIQFSKSGGNVALGIYNDGKADLKLRNLPTSPTGLTSGDVWRDGENLKIVI